MNEKTKVVHLRMRVDLIREVTLKAKRERRTFAAQVGVMLENQLKKKD